jgi:uncharacterized protein YjbI with pentapeptide repeats
MAEMKRFARLVGTFLIAVIVGIGVCSAAWTSWPFFLNWWRALITSTIGIVVGFGAWWLGWQLLQRQAPRMLFSRLTGFLLIGLAVFSGAIGAFSASIPLAPLLRVWWLWLVAGAAGVIVGLGAWWLWWRLPKRQVDRLKFTIRDAKMRADVEDNFRKTIGQLLGGAVVLVGTGFAYLQFTQQQRSAHDLLISNQVAKGFELLGNKEKQLQQRLGGIYALEGVMNASKEYHQPVLEALCVFVRDETKAITGDGPPATDVQAALTVIGRRDASGEGPLQNPDLTSVHVPKAALIRAKLRLANLRNADLSGADLIGANLISADLSGTNLSAATLDDADLTDANLSDANLSGAFLYSAKLYSADLDRADLRGTKKLTQQQLDEACGEDVKLDPRCRSSHAQNRPVAAAHSILPRQPPVQRRRERDSIRDPSAPRSISLAFLQTDVAANCRSHREARPSGAW